MKKELIAALLLILLFSGTLVNIGVNDKMMQRLNYEVKDAYDSAASGDWDTAQQRLDTAISDWLSMDGYTHIFIRHSEIDATTEAFYSMMSDLCAEDSGSLEGSYGMLHAQLLSLIGMEHVSIGSIF